MPSLFSQGSKRGICKQVISHYEDTWTERVNSPPLPQGGYIVIKRINTKIRKPNDTGIFHNSREDVAVLGKVCNELIDKVNELVDKVNELENKVKKMGEEAQ